jgi:hypothetical protein
MRVFPLCTALLLNSLVLAQQSDPSSEPEEFFVFLQNGTAPHLTAGIQSINNVEAVASSLGIQVQATYPIRKQAVLHANMTVEKAKELMNDKRVRGTTIKIHVDLSSGVESCPRRHQCDAGCHY